MLKQCDIFWVLLQKKTTSCIYCSNLTANVTNAEISMRLPNIRFLLDFLYTLAVLKSMFDEKWWRHSDSKLTPYFALSVGT